MTDNDILKALEWCGCEECMAILDLINRQKAEIERYAKENNEKYNKWEILDNRTKQRYAELYEEAKAVVRFEAIKEFAERLKRELQENCPTITAEEDDFSGYDIFETDDIIDNLVKEMAGGTDAET